jgi:hypothetical protein
MRKIKCTKCGKVLEMDDDSLTKLIKDFLSNPRVICGECACSDED